MKEKFCKFLNKFKEIRKVTDHSFLPQNAIFPSVSSCSTRLLLPKQFKLERHLFIQPAILVSLQWSSDGQTEMQRAIKDLGLVKYMERHICRITHYPATTSLQHLFPPFHRMTEQLRLSCPALAQQGHLWQVTQHGVQADVNNSMNGFRW